jgi:RNA polymerase sigma-70 factor, ECF subfamily
MGAPAYETIRQEIRPWIVYTCDMAHAAEFEEFFNQYRLRAFSFALQMAGNREDAMDLTQEAFLRLHRQWGRGDPPQPPAPWFYKVLRNLAIDLLRKRAAGRECCLDDLVLKSGQPDPEAAAARNELAAKVWDAIRRLPLDQREALLLRDWHGLSYADIAETVGTNVGTVSSRIHDARTALRKQIGRRL